MGTHYLTIEPNDVADVAERFWNKVRRGDSATDTCWHWLGAKKITGYGNISIRGKTLTAHRVAWVLTYGVLDPTLTLDHLCRNRACVNPAHGTRAGSPRFEPWEG